MLQDTSLLKGAYWCLESFNNIFSLKQLVLPCPYETLRRSPEGLYKENEKTMVILLSI